MAAFKMLFIAAVLFVGGAKVGGAKQVAAGTSRSEQCRAEGGSCVSAGSCRSPSVAASTCGGGGGAVCCNPSGLEAFARTLELDGFEVGLRVNPCSDRKCLTWYRGQWLADPATCTDKRRLVNFCPTTNQWCCAPPCRRRSRCRRRKGYCVPRKSLCPSGRTRRRLCGGRMCFCCLPDWPVPRCNCSQNRVSVCEPTGTFSLAEDSCVQVHSPGYPYPYDNDASCSLSVVAPSYCRIIVEYCQVELERCPYDYVNVTDGVTSNSYCGSATPAGFTSDANTVDFSFFSDFSQVNRGFQAYLSTSCFDCTQGPTYTVCSDTAITSSTGGLINSPGYPGNYPTFVSCSLTISAPAGSTIRFQYLAFALEPAPPTCSFDFFQIYDTSAPSTTKYCGNIAPSFTASSTNEVTILFSSDKSDVYSGFSICFTVI
ncbi:cubilin-like isoform X3 [Penaeus chinensis]|uniref:cubilin-like isoform X3 n=1 Tax=Penaeus chinensis TaxID=139456 RepID=UPI001FB82223|nr:cubilin-like isoform X3 [Penaeus chinensis]